MPQSTIAESIYSAFGEFTRRTGIRKHAIAKAIGVDKYSLSPSHLQSPNHLNSLQRRLPVCLSKSRLVGIAGALKLNQREFDELQRLAVTICEACSGYQIVSGSPFSNEEQADADGTLGVQFYAEGEWSLACCYLERSWNRLRMRLSDYDDPGYVTAMQVGTQLVSLQAYGGPTLNTRNVVDALVTSAKHYRGTDIIVLRELCRMYNGAGIIYRLRGERTPDNVLSFFKSAERLARDNNLGPELVATTLRDQAKPNVLQGLLNIPDAKDRFDHAIQVLVDSEQELLDYQTSEDYQLQWLYSRFTRIECLAVIGRYDEAERIWDRTMSESWTTEFVERRRPLQLNMKFASMALALGRRDLDTLCTIAASIVEDFDSTLFHERIDRASGLLELAALGDLRQLERLFVK